MHRRLEPRILAPCLLQLAHGYFRQLQRLHLLNALCTCKLMMQHDLPAALNAQGSSGGDAHRCTMPLCSLPRSPGLSRTLTAISVASHDAR